ncbi:hypothetical protein AVEN_238114-1, partial [Araneus ventricosus]
MVAQKRSTESCLRSTDPKIPALQDENGLAYSDSVKAELIASRLGKQFSMNDLTHPKTEAEEFPEYCPTPCPYNLRI